MTAVPTPFITRITKHSHWIEKFCLVCLAVSAILILIDVDASSLIMLSMSSLAVVYFLNAYSVISVERTEDELMGFSDLLALQIIPKVLWISASISTIGILFYFLHMKGFKELLMIGGGSLFVGLFLLGVLVISGAKHVNVLMPVIARAIPLLVIDIYLFFK